MESYWSKPATICWCLLQLPILMPHFLAHTHITKDISTARITSWAITYCCCLRSQENCPSDTYWPHWDPIPTALSSSNLCRADSHDGSNGSYQPGSGQRSKSNCWIPESVWEQIYRKKQKQFKFKVLKSCFHTWYIYICMIIYVCMCLYAYR